MTFPLQIANPQTVRNGGVTICRIFIKFWNYQLFKPKLAAVLFVSIEALPFVPIVPTPLRVIMLSFAIAVISITGFVYVFIFHPPYLALPPLSAPILASSVVYVLSASVNLNA